MMMDAPHESLLSLRRTRLPVFLACRALYMRSGIRSWFRRSSEYLYTDGMRRCNTPLSQASNPPVAINAVEFLAQRTDVAGPLLTGCCSARLKAKSCRPGGNTKLSKYQG